MQNQRTPETPETQKTQKDLINEKLQEGKFPEAMKLMGDYIFSVIENELQTGHRDSWVDSFNNNFSLLSMGLYLLEDLSNDEKEKAKKIVEEVNQP